MRLENTFQVLVPPEQAWDLLMDVPRVVPCMPGAELTDTVDDANWKARMSVKLGPISMTFATDVHREEVDEAARRAVLVASARELRGRGAGRARIESSLDDDGSATTVRIVTDLSLSGAVAQYGGRGMVQAVSAQLIDAFAACLREQLAPSAADGADDAAPGPRAAETRPVEALSAFALARDAAQQRMREVSGGLPLTTRRLAAAVAALVLALAGAALWRRLLHRSERGST
jgi:carbon monoxide dehydrogenase subunit G